MNIREVISNIREGQEYKCGVAKIKCSNDGTIGIINITTNEGIAFLKSDEFTKVEKPVSFMEVVESGKKCRVEHEIVEAILSNANYEGECIYIVDGFKSIKKGEYLKLEDMLLIIGRFAGIGEIQEVIKNGRWYIEK